MANIAEQIRDAAEAEIKTVLPTFEVLAYRYLVEKNHFRNSGDRFAVTLGSAPNVSGLIGHINYEHAFNILLAKQYVNQPNSDSNKDAAVMDLYDKTDEILRVLFENKMGLPQFVSKADDFIVNAPEFLDNDNVVILETELNVQYRVRFKC